MMVLDGLMKLILIIYLGDNMRVTKLDFTQTNETECIALLNKEVSQLREELEYYKESERALKDVLRNMVSKVQTNS
jgi:hypothetical protein